MLAHVFIPIKEREMVDYALWRSADYERELGSEKFKSWKVANDIVIELDLRGPRQLLLGLEYLTELNQVYLMAHPKTKPLYKARIFYEPEPPGQEDWLTIPVLYRLRAGDCEDLACALAAERRVRGVMCSPHLTKKGRVWHVTTLCNDIVEDPSAVLGMYNYVEV